MPRINFNLLNNREFAFFSFDGKRFDEFDTKYEKPWISIIGAFLSSFDNEDFYGLSTKYENSWIFRSMNSNLNLSRETVYGPFQEKYCQMEEIVLNAFSYKLYDNSKTSFSLLYGRLVI